MKSFRTVKLDSYCQLQLQTPICILAVCQMTSNLLRRHQACCCCPVLNLQRSAERSSGKGNLLFSYIEVRYWSPIWPHACKHRMVMMSTPQQVFTAAGGPSVMHRLAHVIQKCTAAVALPSPWPKRLGTRGTGQLNPTLPLLRAIGLPFVLSFTGIL